MAARRSPAKAVAKAPPTKSFNLEEKAVAGPLVRGGRTYTDEQKHDMLKDYVEIPLDLIEYIRYGEYVRYEVADGTFNPGGLVFKNPMPVVNGGEAKKLLQLHAGKPGAAGYKKWTVAYDQLAHVYIKPNAITRVMMRNIEKVAVLLDRNAATMREYMAELNARLEKIERKVRRH